MKNYRAELTGVFGDPVDDNPTGVVEEAAFAAKIAKRIPRTKVRGSPVCGNLVIYIEKNAYSISPLSFNRSSMSVSFTFFKTTFNISFSLKESLASEMGFLSIA